MKVRMKTDIMGSFYGIEAQHLFSVRRGDVVELSEPEMVLREVFCDRVELALSGPIGPRTKGANVKDLRTAQKLVAEAAARRPATGICDCGCGQVRRPELRPLLRDKIRKITG